MAPLGLPAYFAEICWDVKSAANTGMSLQFFAAYRFHNVQGVKIEREPHYRLTADSALTLLFMTTRKRTSTFSDGLMNINSIVSKCIMKHLEPLHFTRIMQCIECEAALALARARVFVCVCVRARTHRVCARVPGRTHMPSSRLR